MNGSKREDVLLNMTEITTKSMEIDVFLVITKISCSFIGLPPNIFLATIIIQLRQLHRKPRNIFLLGMVFSNLIAFLPAFIELLYWNVPTESVCLVYVTIVGLPHAILLLTTFFALADRFVAINYPLWHREKVTANGAARFLILSILSLIFLLKFVYITGIIPFRCEFKFIHSVIIWWTMVVLFVLCIVVHFTVYQKTKSLLLESRNIIRPNIEAYSKDLTKKKIQKPTNQRITEEEFDLEFIELHRSASSNQSGDLQEFNKTTHEDANTPNVNYSTNEMAIHVKKGVLSQIEMEATRTLIAGVASLFLMVCPLLLFVLIFLICRLIFKSDCNSMIGIGPYFKELNLIYAVYNPLIYLFRNSELWSVLKDRVKNCCRQNDK